VTGRLVRRERYEPANGNGIDTDVQVSGHPVDRILKSRALEVIADVVDVQRCPDDCP
jgi:hypothetical protein